ncbi:MAG TPA: hypothetical protein VGR84_10215 [Candidatus Acidoferrales bacterium]|nr:hypothetical protein [Candidatus Acidoferrales bacterium]
MMRFKSTLGACTFLFGILVLVPAMGRPDFNHHVAHMKTAITTTEAEQGENSRRVRVAAGEYEVLQGADAGGIGSYAPGVYNFRESWTLWRSPDGGFEVEGEREYESPKDELHSNRFSVHLSPDFRTLGVKEFRKLRWKPDSGPLSCEFQPSEMICTSSAKDPSQSVDLNVPMRDAYGFLWPISAFSLSNITRRAAKIHDKLTPVQLVTVEEPSPRNPVFVSTLDGNLKYLTQEEITLAGKKWRADKFELKVPLHPAFIIWTSTEGLLLRFAPESKSTQAADGLQLVHFQQDVNF